MPMLRVDRWVYDEETDTLHLSFQGSPVADVTLEGEARELWEHLRAERLQPEIRQSEVDMLSNVHEMEKVD